MSTAIVTDAPADEHAHEEHHDHELSFLSKYVFSKDHKVIAIQFLVSALTLFFVGGLLALMLRWQLAWPYDLPLGDKFPETVTSAVPNEAGETTYQMGGGFFTMLVTMHGTVMIFFVIIPLLMGAYANYLIPLQIGARDMAFPTLNMLSYWFIPPAAIVMGLPWIFGLIVHWFPSTEESIGAFMTHAASGWTSYPSLSAKALDGSAYTPGSVFGQTCWIFSVLLVGTSSIMGAVNYITTVIMMRSPGMSLFRMPLSVWSIFVTAVLIIFGTPVLTSAAFMLLLDRTLDTNFFKPEMGGQPLLYQHLFWFYSHPAVYIMILPAMGMVSDILSTYARKPIFGYRPMVYSMASIGGLGFIVWGHHMFQSGMNPALGMTFMISTTMIALPSAVKTFNWLTTLWKSNMQLTPSMCNALAFVGMFVLGGLSGIFMASTPVDIYIHDTYFIVGHIHYVLFGGSMFAVFAAVQYWFPKMFGRFYSNSVGYVHFVLTFIFFNWTFFPMHVIGIAGHPRRIAVGWDKVNEAGYRFIEPVQWMNEFMTIGAVLLGLVQIIFAAGFIYSVFWGKKCEDPNPWKANSLEWCATPVVPGHGNFGPELPTVYRGAFEFASPLVEEDYLPQNKALDDE